MISALLCLGALAFLFFPAAASPSVFILQNLNPCACAGCSCCPDGSFLDQRSQSCKCCPSAAAAAAAAAACFGSATSNFADACTHSVSRHNQSQRIVNLTARIPMRASRISRWRHILRNESGRRHSESAQTRLSAAVQGVTGPCVALTVQWGSRAHAEGTELEGL